MMTYENYAILRNLQGMKDSDVAKKAGIPQSTFSDWKKGKSSPKTDKLDKIRRALGIPMSDFFGYDTAESIEVIQMSAMKQLENLEMLKEEMKHYTNESLEVAKGFDSLNEEEQRMIIEMIAFYKSKKNNE